MSDIHPNRYEKSPDERSIYKRYEDLRKERDALQAQVAELKASAVVPEDEVSLQDAANKICKHLPEGFEIRLCMENGAAWVEMRDDHVDVSGLVDMDNIFLATQLNNALCVARGWLEQEQES